MTQWTDEQEAIFKGLASGAVMGEALAGSGKSTTIAEAIKRAKAANPKLEILLVAFNKKIQLDNEKKIGTDARCKTMNGLGHSAWGKYLGKRLVLETTKVGTLVTEVCKEHDRQDNWAAVRNLVSKAKTSGLMPQGGPPTRLEGLPTDCRENWETLADHYDEDCDDETIDMCRKVLVKSVKQAFQGVIDFDDQICMPTCYGAPFDRFDIPIVDEAQDLNRLQHEMVVKSCKPLGYIGAVGDRRQAIYGFRGALEDSMDQLLTRMPNAQQLGLTTCWRCSQSVIEHTQELVAAIKHAPKAPSGSVTTEGEWNENLFEKGDVVLCRNNAPLIALAFRLIGMGKGCFVMGRDIGKALTKVIEKCLRQREDCNLEILLGELKNWETRELLNARAKGDEAKERQIQDKSESIRAVCSFSGANSAKGVIAAIDQLFSKDTAPIVLSTIHKFKGLEAPRVLALDRDLLCPPWLKGTWQKAQDINLDYVLRTRAQLHLKYISSEGWKH